MMNAPCARLMMFMMPHTRRKPSATTARVPPARMPLTRSWKKSCTLNSYLTLSPRRRRIHGLTVGRKCRPDCHKLPVLNLVYDHRLVDVQAARIEFDDPVERHDVEALQCIAHFLGIERSGFRERVLEG